MGGGRQIYPCFCPLTLVYVLYTFTHKNFVMCRDDAMRDTDETGTITLAFRAPRALAAAAERAAASRSAVARRALLRDNHRRPPTAQQQTNQNQNTNTIRPPRPIRGIPLLP